MPRIILLVPLFLSLAACVSPRIAAPTVAHQSVAINALAATYANDLALLRTHTETLLHIQRTTTLGSLHRELIEHGFISPTGAPDPASFAAALADPTNSATLILEVRSGRMTTEQANRFLTDYAILADHSNAHSLQQQALETLHPAQLLAEAFATLRAALDAHAQDITSLFSELSESNTALTVFTSTPPRPTFSSPDARTLWRNLITTTIPDSARQDAALKLLDDILAQ